MVYSDACEPMVYISGHISYKSGGSTYYSAGNVFLKWDDFRPTSFVTTVIGNLQTDNSVIAIAAPLRTSLNNVIELVLQSDSSTLATTIVTSKYDKTGSKVWSKKIANIGTNTAGLYHA